MKQPITLYTYILTVFLSMWACSDEVENLIEQRADTVYDTLASLPNARILSYSVENAPTTIYSAINDSASTITVYLPSYYTLQFIDPAIELPEGASITPDGEEFVPVFSEDPFIYTVSAPGEPDMLYTVIPEVQQPTIILEELSTASDTLVLDPRSFIRLSGENFIPDVDVTKAFLIHGESENEWELNHANDGRETSNSISFRSLLGFGEEVVNNLPGGPYWLEMRAYALTVRMKYPVLIGEL